MKRGLLTVFMGVLLFLLAFGCQMGDSGGDDSGDTGGGDTGGGDLGGGDTGPTVYICGAVYGSVNTPSYWKNQERVDLPIPEGATGGRVEDIIVVDDVVYCVGVYTDSESNYHSCLWTDSVRTDLAVTGGTDRGAYGIDIENDVIYIFGLYQPDPGTDYAMYSLIDGEFSTLSSVYGVNDTEQLMVENGVLYIAMDESNYYIDDVRYIHPMDSGTSLHINDIHAVDGTVYTAGNFNPDTSVWSNPYYASYWTGTVRTELSTPDGYSSTAYAMDISDGVVYNGGRLKKDGEPDTPCYWTGTVRTDLPLGDSWTNGSVEDIMVIGDSVISAGALWSDTAEGPLCYWIGSELTEIPAEDGFYYSINTVYVVE